MKKSHNAVTRSIFSAAVTAVVGAALSTTLFAGTPGPDLGTEQAGYAARQEVVPDFGALIPHDPQAGTRKAQAVELQRVTTGVPWARGMVEVDGELVLLSRGRHRGEGGPSQTLDDKAGVIWKVDASVAEPVVPGELAGEAVGNNATAWIEPTNPPFYLYTRDVPPEEDTLMARPFCALAYDPVSGNLFVCAYSGAELPDGFRKHATDAVYRYDSRDQAWHVVEQHNPASVPAEELGAVIGNTYYPHHDPETNPAPHGWLNGPDGCIVAGDYLYVPAKDNHLVVQYDLSAIREQADAPPPASRPVLGPRMLIRHPGGETEMDVLGPSGVDTDGEFLYVAYRTSSVVVRIPLDDTGDLVRPDQGLIEADLIAVFEPWDKDKKRSGNLYDISLASNGDLFVSLGTQGRVWRVTPDPDKPFYGNDQTDRPTTTPPFLDLTELVGKKTGCNNILATDDGWLYVSTRNNDTGGGEIHGTIYRARIE